MSKTLSFAAIHFTIAFSLTYAMTGSLMTGSAVAFIEPVVNTVAYYLHDRFWPAKGGKQKDSALPAQGFVMSAQ